MIERLDRAKAAGQLRPDVDTRVLAAMVDGPVLHAVLGGMADSIDESWISSLVRTILDGAASHSDRSDRTTNRTTNRTTRKVTVP